MCLLNLLIHELLSLGVDLSLNFSADLFAFDHLGDLVVVPVVEHLELLFQLLLLGCLLGDSHLRHLQLRLDLLSLGHLLQLE